MTREEFLSFDTRKFYEPGYEEDKQYMGFLTGVFILAMTDADGKYRESLEKGNKTVEPNAFSMWFNSDRTLRNLFKKSGCPQGPFECTEFLDEYESYLKNFIRAYHSQVAEITQNNDNYYFYSTYKKKIISSIFTQITATVDTNPCEILKEKGFCDLRYITAFAFDKKNPSKLIEKDYGDEMADCYNMFESTTIKLIDNLAAEKDDNTKTNKK